MISDVYNPLPYVHWADVSLKLMPGDSKWVNGIRKTNKITNYYLESQRFTRNDHHLVASKPIFTKNNSLKGE